MLAEQRKELICNMINRKKAVKVSELSKRFGITEATIRRDLDELQNEKKIRRTHGGAVALYPAGIEYVISELAIRNIEEKRKIAKRAYDCIDDFDSMLLDGSSTVLELSRLIAEGDKKGITVVTNAFSVVSILSKKPDITVIHTGGKAKNQINSAVGKIAERAIRDIRVDKTFIGINGIDVNFGYSITLLDEAAVKKEMLQSAKQVYVLADHTKFGESYLAKLADFTGEIDFLITDQRIEDFDYVPFYEAVNLIVVDDEVEEKGL